MPSLRKELRSQLEKYIVAARHGAEAGAREALVALAVGEAKPFDHLSKDELKLRIDLRAHGRAVGDQRDKVSGRQTTDHLAQAVAYEHWHRMLFARFLTENGCLLEPSSRVAVSLADLDELARDERTDLWTLAGRFAAQMLPQIFRPDDPALALTLPPETRQSLEKLLTGLPVDVFLADDSLGWVYQFWQTEAKATANGSGEKIGADTLSAVTQLFTEDYMVDFMLHNTLGAWHAGKIAASTPLVGDTEDVLCAAVSLPGQPWNYLRWVKSESGRWTPAAGTFESWPRRASELTILDPCMGSGHFLVAVLPLLARLRMAEENISSAVAARAVLRDNLHGLELDPRCAQIAGFNLALAAWKFAPELLHETEPLTLHLACCGLQLQGAEAEWQEIARQTARRSGLGGSDQLFTDQGRLHGALEDRVVIGMRALHDLFRQAPVLGSLIDPRRALAGEMALFTDWDQLAPVLQQALAGENFGDAESHELAVQVQGLAKAAELIAARYHLVVTNVPYLARGKQNGSLKEHCERVYPDAKSDLATCFIERCLAFCKIGGSTALVTPQNWLFLGTYENLRRTLLAGATWNWVVKLGPAAFQDMNWWAANTALFALSLGNAASTHHIAGLDVSGPRDPLLKAGLLRTVELTIGVQSAQLNHPDARILLGDMSDLPLLHEYATAYQGIATADYPRFGRFFWELPVMSNGWVAQQSTVGENVEYGGREHVLFWEDGAGALAKSEQARIQGLEAIGRTGVAVSQMNRLPVTLFTGDFYDNNCAAIVAKDPANVPAIWAFCSSEQFRAAVRTIDQKSSVTNATFGKVPFDLQHWSAVASSRYPNGLPTPEASDPTQWLFSGHPSSSTQTLHVAFCRLMGFRWPRQAGAKFVGCPALAADELPPFEDADGIVCLASVRGEASAADRLHSALVAALGDYDEHSVIRAAGGNSRSLEEWLRNEAFEQHCKLFHQRPFIWHIWDGRSDGFHAFVNYHKLAAPNRDGEKLLRLLAFSYLKDWIDKQKDENKKPGAEDRLIAAQALQRELEAILAGEPPYDLFIRWKPLHQQAIGWEPDINDGVRLNIRPFLNASPVGRKGAGILRTKPGNSLNWKKDRGEEPMRSKADYPWFWGWDERSENFACGADFDGNRWNDCHYTPAFKRAAREAKSNLPIQG